MIRFFLGSGGRLITFTLLQAFAYIVLGGAIVTIAPDGGAPQMPDDPALQLLMMVVMVAVQGLGLQLFLAGVKGRRVRAFTLVFAVALITGTILTQIDSFIYLEAFRQGPFGRMIVTLGIATSLTAALFACFMFQRGTWAGNKIDLPSRKSKWSLALALFALGHVVVYYTLGYYIVWVNPEARAYYGGPEFLPFFAHTATVFAESSWIVIMQIVRGLLWAFVAVLVFRFSAGGRIRLTTVTLVIYTGFHVAPLIVPNTLMPDMVRHLHLVELGLTAVFMALLALLLFRPLAFRTG